MLKNKFLMSGLIIFLSILIIAIAAPFISTYHNAYTEADGTTGKNLIGDYQQPQYTYLPPKIPVLEYFHIADGVVEGEDLYASAQVPDGKYFYFGTDQFGRDQFVRIMVGTLVSLLFALIVVLTQVLIGLILGIISGYYQGYIGIVLQKVALVLNGVPTIIWIILMIGMFGPGVKSLMFGLIISSWTFIYRLIRVQVLQIKSKGYIMNSKLLGMSNLYIIRRHIIPSLLPYVFMSIIFFIPYIILYEASISFLGLGIQLPIPSLGTLLNQAIFDYQYHFYMMIIPVLMLCLITLSLHLISEGLKRSVSIDLIRSKDE